MAAARLLSRAPATRPRPPPPPAAATNKALPRLTFLPAVRSERGGPPVSAPLQTPRVPKVRAARGGPLGLTEGERPQPPPGPPALPRRPALPKREGVDLAPDALPTRHPCSGPSRLPSTLPYFPPPSASICLSGHPCSITEALSSRVLCTDLWPFKPPAPLQRGGSPLCSLMTLAACPQTHVSPANRLRPELSRTSELLSELSFASWCWACPQPGSEATVLRFVLIPDSPRSVPVQPSPPSPGLSVEPRSHPVWPCPRQACVPGMGTWDLAVSA